MIKSFKDKRTEDIYNNIIVKKVELKILKKALRRLKYIDAAKKIEDLMVPPSNKLEKKKGKLKDFYAIWVNDQYRIIFRWKDGNAYDAQFVDYH